MQGKIMIVEDDLTIRELLRAVFMGEGYTVVETGDGLSALPLAQEERPDIVLLDIGLPGMDGLGVLGQLKDDPELRDTPVIMVTAWAEPALVARALDRGAHDYVRKPFDVSELTERVEAVLREEPGPLGAESAGHDPLTALPTRPHLDEVLERQAETAVRTGRTFSVLHVDLDNFARVNDGFGVEVGDDALRAAAKRLRQRARVSDVVVRWGGDEFVIVAPGTDHDGAAALADHLRRALADAPLDTPTAAVRVSATVGFAEFDPSEPTNDLLARAIAGATPVLA